MSSERPDERIQDVDPLFQFHKLNAEGIEKAKKIAHAFNHLLDDLKYIVLEEPGRSEVSRQMAIVRTHLETACFHAKKAMANQTYNQEGFPFKY